MFITLTILICVHSDHKYIHPPVNKYVATEFNSAAHDLKILNQTLSKQRRSIKLRPLMKDIKLILKATSYEQENKSDKARESWKVALIESSGPFAEKAFKGWLNNLIVDINTPQDRSILAQLVLYHTRNGSLSEFMMKNHLNSVDKLEAYLKKHYPHIKKSPHEQSQKDDFVEFAKLTDEHEDPLLISFSKTFCELGSTEKDRYNQWYKKQRPIVKDYWNGLVAKCEGKDAKAIEFFQKSSNSASTSNDLKDHPFAVSSLEFLVKLLRINDGRSKAASYYKALVNAWSLPGVSAESMGLNPYSFNIKQIDDFLWASRYRALIGDYENAHTFALHAINLISETPNKIDKLSESLSKELASYEAEAYNILASRIAVEKREYDTASSLMATALKNPYLSQIWTKRFSWQLGLYRLLSGDLEGTINIWEDLLKQSEMHERAKILFWLGHVYHKRGQSAESIHYYEELSQKYPLNFYHIVGTKLENLTSPNRMEQIFKNPTQLAVKLYRQNNLTTDSLRNTSVFSQTLAKTEFFLFAGLKNWAKYTTPYLYRNALSSFKFKEDAEGLLYLSRLFYGTGDYLRAIALTNSLDNNSDKFWQKRPEQIHIYFPRAYSHIYQKEAQLQSVDPALLYAISRQESSFDWQAKSFANAYGLMQIIKPTANRLTKYTSFEWEHIKDNLLEPEINIKLGSIYNKLLQIRYKGNLPAAIAAYNAGEYAVDVWIRRRNHPNPLLWIELIPFGETRDYVQKVWRNYEMYKFLGNEQSIVNLVPNLDHLRHIKLVKNDKLLHQ